MPLCKITKIIQNKVWHPTSVCRFKPNNVVSENYLTFFKNSKIKYIMVNSKHILIHSVQRRIKLFALQVSFCSNLSIVSYFKFFEKFQQMFMKMLELTLKLHCFSVCNLSLEWLLPLQMRQMTRIARNDFPFVQQSASEQQILSIFNETNRTNFFDSHNV